MNEDKFKQRLQACMDELGVLAMVLRDEVGCQNLGLRITVVTGGRYAKASIDYNYLPAAPLVARIEAEIRGNH